MALSITKIISGLFGSKSARDTEQILPIVKSITIEFDKLHGLTDDGLREKTKELKEIISAKLDSISKEIESLKNQSEDEGVDIDKKENLFKEIDRLVKEKDNQTEIVLNEILPVAFAVVKETARRYAVNKKLIVTATLWDREISIKKQNVV